MSDPEIPQPTPDAHPSPAPEGSAQPAPVPAPAPIDGGGAGSSPPAPPQAGAQPAPQAPRAPSAPATPARRSLRGWAPWVLAALLFAAAGITGSLLGAHAIARHDAKQARKTFRAQAAAVAVTVAKSIQHEEDLVQSAGTFFAGNAKSTPAEFKAWANWVHALRRFPQIERLGLVSIVRSTQLESFEQQIGVRAKAAKSPAPGAAKRLTAPATATALATTGAPAATTTPATITPATAAPATTRIKPFHISPAGGRSFYCFTVAEVTRAPARPLPAGRDYCAHSYALLLSRDSGQASYAPTVNADTGTTSSLRYETPIFKGNEQPKTAAQRVAMFAGWLREVVVPGAILRQAMAAHGTNGARLVFQDEATGSVFTAGAIEQPRAQSHTTTLSRNWSITSFAAPPTTDVLHDAGALAFAIAAGVLSLVLGFVIVMLGAPARRPQLPQLPRLARRSATPADGIAPDPLHDPLTGLPTRALTLDRAERMLARAGRESGLIAGALYVDLDWFKDVNEKIGETAGDQLLRIVAERLEHVVRTHDTVGRLSEDEFLIVVEATARDARLDSLARRVIEALHQPVDLEGFGPSFFQTASIGVAFGRYQTAEELVRDAELALRASKAAGKDRYTIFNANMRSVIEDRGVLEAELNAALVERELFLLYQPVLDLATQKVVALEALLRWNHPKRGVLAPADFLAVAEETGLIVPIGRWALEEACNRAAAWDVAGHPLEVGVSVSPNQLRRDGFVTDVQRALQQSGIRPELLTLEIAEETIMEDLAAATRRLNDIKQLGVRMAIDDFGSGYAYRSDLERMPLDYLKVDRSSLAAADDEDYRHWLLEAILVFGRDLSLTVVAKGVETYEQMAVLKDMGCPLAQGFFLGKPMPGETVENIFRQRHSSAAATAPATQPAPVAPNASAAPTAPAPQADPAAQPDPAAPTASAAPPAPAAPTAPAASPAPADVSAPAATATATATPSATVATPAPSDEESGAAPPDETHE